MLLRDIWDLFNLSQSDPINQVIPLIMVPLGGAHYSSGFGFKLQLQLQLQLQFQLQLQLQLQFLPYRWEGTISFGAVFS